MSLAFAAAASAAGGSASVATDPNANSPAGVIYSIPLDSARQDAAPHHGRGGAGAAAGLGGGGSSGGGSGGGGASGGGSGGSGSSGAGSGSPTGSPSASGTSRAAALAARRPSPQTVRVLVPGGQPGSLVHSSNGFGSSSQVPGLSGPTGPGLAAVRTNASSAPVIAIILAILVMAIGVLAGARAWRNSRMVPVD